MEKKGFIKGFVMVPKQLILDTNLSNNAKVLFIYIRSLSENFRTLRNSNLRQKLGISLKTLQNCKAELIKHGYLKIYRRKSANYYYILVGKRDVDKLKTKQNLPSQSE
jgi:Mn-dependent DtxR family transcriptional regulator